MMNTVNTNPTWTARGRLRVAAFETDVGRPAPGARITINPTDHPDRVVEQMMTDESGQTLTIELAAPPEELSLSEADERFKPIALTTFLWSERASRPCG